MLFINIFIPTNLADPWCYKEEEVRENVKVMRESFIVTNETIAFTTNWGTKGAVTCMVWAICWVINTIGWLASWACYLTGIELTIIEMHVYDTITGVTIMLLGRQTFLWIDGVGGHQEGVSLKLSTWVEEMVPFGYSMLTGGWTLPSDSPILNLSRTLESST